MMRSWLPALLLFVAACGGGSGGNGPRKKTSNPKSDAAVKRATALLDTPVDALRASERGKELRHLMETAFTTKPTLKEHVVRAEVFEALGDLHSALAELDAAFKIEQRIQILVHRIVLRAAMVATPRSALTPVFQKELPWPPFFSPMAEPELTVDESKRITAEFEAAYRLLSGTGEADAVSIIELSKRLITGRYNEILTTVERQLGHPVYGGFAARIQALAALRSGNTDVARQAAERVRRKHPVLLESFLIEGHALLAEGRHEAARNPIEIAVQLAPSNLDAAAAAVFLSWKRGSSDHARKQLDALPDFDLVSRPLRFVLALMLIQEGKKGTAVAEAAVFASGHPEEAVGYMGRGWVHYQVQKLDKALADLDDAVRVAGNRFEPLALRGMVYYSGGNYREAAQDFRGADRLFPGDPQILFSLASALYRLGDTDALREAEEILTRALKKVPTSVPYLIERARTRMELGLLDAARDDVRKIRMFDAASVEADMISASVLLREEKFEQAEVVLDGIVAKHPEQIEAMLIRGIVRFRRDKFKEAVQDLSIVARVHESNVRAWEYLGHARARLGESISALKAFDRAVKLSPNSARLLRVRGILRMREGRKSGARDDLEKALKLRPEWDKELKPFLDQLQDD